MKRAALPHLLAPIPAGLRMANPWTPERRAKQAQAIHAWQPWKLATGPRSDEGKVKASRNAYAGAVRLQLGELGRALRELEDGVHARA